MDGISVEFTINNVESHTSHVLFTENTLFGSVLERWNHWFFDFIHILDSLSNIDNHVGASVFWTETPNLGSIVLFPTEFFNQSLTSGFDILRGIDFTVFDKVWEIFVKWASSTGKSIVFVLRFGHSWLRRFSSHTFLIGDNWIRFNDWDLSEIVFQIVKTDFNVEFTTSGNDVLTGLFEWTDN